MTVTRTDLSNPPWLLIAFSLARKSASSRVLVWRRLQRYGAIPLGNSGYLLPNNPENRERFEWLAALIRGVSGEASVLEVQSIDNWPDTKLKERFSEARTRDYRELLTDLRAAARSPKKQAVRITRLRQRFLDIVSIDFFGSRMREQVERALNESASRDLEIGTHSRREYQKRTWVTRPRPGVDRVLSAWLIRKFIDTKPRFVFASEGQKPAGAIPFDMYEGGFGHRGEDCTFETLVKAFLIRDKRVGVMAEVVHDADLFDEKYGRNEGFGIDAVMKGLARRGLSDHELLNRGMELAEGLYRSLG